MLYPIKKCLTDQFKSSHLRNQTPAKTKYKNNSKLEQSPRRSKMILGIHISLLNKIQTPSCLTEVARHRFVRNQFPYKISLKVCRYHLCFIKITGSISNFRF